MNVQKIGEIDGIASVGSMEHYCSGQEYMEGKQDKIYQEYFKLCAEILPTGGRLYNQTQVWGKRIPNYHEISVKAKRHTDEWNVAMIEKFYPGTWLPTGYDQIKRAAEPLFKVISRESAGSDYIETMIQMEKKILHFSIKKIFPILKLSPRLFLDKSFWRLLRHRCHRECFRRELMNLERVTFEKI
jgi:cyclopropane-fatty-acyl-phospholipid synthase